MPRSRNRRRKQLQKTVIPGSHPLHPLAEILAREMQQVLRSRYGSGPWSMEQLRETFREMGVGVDGGPVR